MTTHNSTGEGLALCALLPTPGEVTNELSVLGFTLTFQMDAYHPSASSPVPPLGAQYHYRQSSDGCEVIFLEGPEKSEDARYYPKHEACFWIYPGKSPMFYQRIAQALSTKWPLLWRKFPTWASRPRASSPDQSHIAL